MAVAAAGGLVGVATSGVAGTGSDVSVAAKVEVASWRTVTSVRAIISSSVTSGSSSAHSGSKEARSIAAPTEAVCKAGSVTAIRYDPSPFSRTPHL